MSSIRHMGEDWFDSLLSKTYKKDSTPVIDELLSRGLIIINGELPNSTKINISCGMCN